MAPRTIDTTVSRIWLQDRMTQGILLRRVFAWFFDTLILGAVAMAMWVFSFTFTVATFGFGAPIFGAIAFLPLLYAFISLLTPMQASPGQALLGLIVVRNDDFGPPEPLQALVYAAGYCITMAAGLIWVAVALVTTRHRTFHDMLAGLVVVRRSALETYLTHAP
jgi:uncharacterized RDD family membrane protein YckC